MSAQNSTNNSKNEQRYPLPSTAIKITLHLKMPLSPPLHYYGIFITPTQLSLPTPPPHPPHGHHHPLSPSPPTRSNDQSHDQI